MCCGLPETETKLSVAIGWYRAKNEDSRAISYFDSLLKYMKIYI